MPQTKTLTMLFTDHPTAVGETYLEHFGVASRYAGRLFAAGFCALVHAFLPFAFEKTASNAIKSMYANMTKRGADRIIAIDVVAEIDRKSVV